jgi:hypothetical protein
MHGNMIKYGPCLWHFDIACNVEGISTLNVCSTPCDISVYVYGRSYARESPESYQRMFKIPIYGFCPGGFALVESTHRLCAAFCKDGCVYRILTHLYNHCSSPAMIASAMEPCHGGDTGDAVSDGGGGGCSDDDDDDDDDDERAPPPPPLSRKCNGTHASIPAGASAAQQQDLSERSAFTCECMSVARERAESIEPEVARVVQLEHIRASLSDRVSSSAARITKTAQ